MFTFLSVAFQIYIWSNIRSRPDSPTYRSWTDMLYIWLGIAEFVLRGSAQNLVTASKVIKPRNGREGDEVFEGMRRVRRSRRGDVYETLGGGKRKKQ